MEKLETLHPYQITGANWLASKKVALLADTMGLGKSAQAIRALDLIGAKRVIIVCPAIARITWHREILKWGQNTSRDITIVAKRKNKPKGTENEIVICSFDYVSFNFNELAFTKRDVLVVDESHYIKSPESARTKAILSKTGLIHSVKRAWFLTGTPTPNNPFELWPMLTAFGATNLGREDFITRYCSWYNFNGRRCITGFNTKNTHELRAVLAPVMLRRLTKEVLKDLPPVNISHVPIEAELDGLTPDLKEEFKKLESIIGPQRHTSELEKMGMLETIANSVSTLRRYCAITKVKPMCDLISEELENKAYDKIIIFAIYREAIDGIMGRLAAFRPVRIYGSDGAIERQRAIDTFQRDKTCRVFVGNIQAASTNITLTAANQVAFLEAAWTPGDNQQCIGRAARIGQTLPVFARFFSIAGTVDETVLAAVAKKTKEIQELIG